MESVLSMWQDFCRIIPLVILGSLGIAGTAGLIARTVKNMIL